MQSKDDNPSCQEQLSTLIDSIKLLSSKITRFNEVVVGQRVEDSTQVVRQFLKIQPEDTSLSEINKKWALEDTGFTKLANACEQMRNILASTYIEADKAFQIAQESQASAVESDMREQEMRKIVKKLWKENTRLKEEIHQKSHQNEVIIKSLKIIMKQNRTLSEEKVLAVMDLHNRIVSSAADQCHEKNQDPVFESSNGILEKEALQSTIESTTKEDEDECCTDSTQSATSSMSCAESSALDFVSDKSDWDTAQSGAYKIEFTNKIGLQFQLVPISRSMNSTSAIINEIEEPCSAEFSPSSHSFLICGFRGYEKCNSTPPPSLGARLIALNDFSFERGNWTLTDVKDLISSTPKPVTLTFRDDPLDEIQNEILMKAVARTMGKKFTSMEKVFPSSSLISKGWISSSPLPESKKSTRKKYTAPSKISKTRIFQKGLIPQQVQEKDLTESPYRNTKLSRSTLNKEPQSPTKINLAKVGTGFFTALKNM